MCSNKIYEFLVILLINNCFNLTTPSTALPAFLFPTHFCVFQRACRRHGREVIVGLRTASGLVSKLLRHGMPCLRILWDFPVRLHQIDCRIKKLYIFVELNN